MGLDARKHIGGQRGKEGLQFSDSLGANLPVADFSQRAHEPRVHEPELERTWVIRVVNVVDGTDLRAIGLLVRGSQCGR